MFGRLGTWCHDRRRTVVVLWLALVVALGAAGGVAGDAYSDDFGLPDVESGRGIEVLEEDFGGAGAGFGGSIVFRAEQGVDAPEVRAAMEALFDDVAAAPGVVAVVSPYAEEGASQVSPFGDDAGAIAFARIELDPDLSFEQTTEVRDLVLEDLPEVDGLQVELGGAGLAAFETPSSELLGLAFAVVILVVAFGSVLAMGLPVGVALAGMGVGTLLMVLASHLVTVPETAQFLGIMIGIGVGIDYALFIVTRHREEVRAGADVRTAVGTAIDTAGRAVLFAGTTVVISLLGMLLVGVAFVQGLAVGAAIVVAVTVVASLTLLPALLGFAGAALERTRVRGIAAAGLVSLGLVGLGLSLAPLTVAFPLAVVVLAAGTFFAPLRREVHRRPPKPLRRTLAARWARGVQAHPWLGALLGAGVLLVLSVPVLGLRLGFADEGNFAEGTTTREAYDLVAEGFGPGANGPLILVAELPDGASFVDDLGPLTERLGAVDDVFVALPPTPDDAAAPTAALWQVIPETAPQDERTEALVERLRTDVLDPFEAETGIEVLVTGTVAANVDFAGFLTERMPVFFAAVLVLSFVLLMAVFRSLLVPLKAVVMNLLSIGAAYGAVVALFQWGWLSTLTGVQPAPIEPWAPMMLFAIVFGLSMDYEVFLLSRIREESLRTGDSSAAVADGLAATAKVITAAAAIMVVVFGAFILEADRAIKLMGTGLALAILLDATVVRMLLVPSTMELLGARNWWLPRWLDRLLPTIDVEGGHPPDGGAPPRPEERELEKV